MARFRFTLNSITCHQPRSAGQYHDAVALTFLAALPGKPPDPDAFMTSPLGVQGPRFTCLFGRGYTHSLAVNPRAFGPGFDRPWSVEIDLPESGADRIISIQIVNQRGVEDPYKYTKIVTSLALAAGMGAAGAAASVAILGEGAKTLTKVVAAGLGGVAGEGVKKFFEGLWSDWPECGGEVFRLDLPVSVQNLGDLGTPATLVSELLAPAGEDCHQPVYTVEMSFESAEPMVLPPPNEVVSTKYLPIDYPAKSKWAGRWSSSPSAPYVVVSIKPSVSGAIVGRIDGSPGYTVTVSEDVSRGRARRKLIEGAQFDPVHAESRRDLPYHGKKVTGRWKRDSPVASIGEAGVQVARSRRSRTAEQALGALQIERSLQNQAATSGYMMRNLGSAGGLGKIWGGELMTADQLKPETRISAAVIDQLVAGSLTEAGATMVVPEQHIVLRLYQRIDTMGDGSIQKSTVLRYTRADGFQASDADHELAKYKDVN